MNYRRNHYVPIWYQKRFLRSMKQKELHLLDSTPPLYVGGDGRSRLGPAVRRRSTDDCFVETDLYTTFFERNYSTEIEQKFFGKIDKIAPELMDALENFAHPLNTDPQRLVDALKIMSIQKLRTPKGIKNLEYDLRLRSKNNLLYEMQKIKNLYCAVWTECVWQIADASTSTTKFIISDHPVTVYNRACYPGSAECGKANDPDIRHFGSQTLFPISSEKILILTNLSYVRDPFGNPMRTRPNPNMFRDTIFNALDIQTNRSLSEIEVITINYIIKKRAFRFIAAAEKDWLFPEKYLENRGWFTLGGGDILMPDPRGVKFINESFVGSGNRVSRAFDAYGIRPGQSGYADKNRDNREWTTFAAAKAAFALKHGPKRRGRAGHLPTGDPIEDDSEMHQHHISAAKHLKTIKTWQRK